MGEVAWDVKTRRKVLLDIAMRRAKPGTGSDKDFLLKRTANMKWIDFSPVLGRIKWAVIGAVATRHYMPERKTMDIDIMIRDADSTKARTKLVKAGFIYKSELSIDRSSWISHNKKMVDVMEGSQIWVDEALTEARKNRDKQGLPILPFRYLVLMKYQAGRTIDLGDVSRMLGQANQNLLTEVRQVFLTYEPEGIEDLENMITLGQLEFK